MNTFHQCFSCKGFKFKPYDTPSMLVLVILQRFYQGDLQPRMQLDEPLPEQRDQPRGNHEHQYEQSGGGQDARTQRGNKEQDPGNGSDWNHLGDNAARMI